jgi:glycosyltransferase involved in cell wall biosynthesis
MLPSLFVVPCYNEARRLDVDAFMSYGQQNASVSFLFVDDGSKDATRALIEGACQRLPEQLSLLALAVNRGKAEAVRQGLVAALATSTPVVGYIDADLATPLDELSAMRAFFDEARVEIVLGARVALLGRDIKRSLVRHYLGRVFATAASNILRLPVYDTQCGAKLFRNGPLAREVFGRPFDSNWAFDVEVFARYSEVARRSGRSLLDMAIEYPLQRWRDVSGSKLKPQAAVGAAAELWNIWRKYG